MIVDTSAVLAILFGEQDAEVYAKAIASAEHCRISAATFVEISIVMELQTGDKGSRRWDVFFRSAELVAEPVTEEQAYVARQAYSDFGKGGKTGGLNFGDCFSHSLAKTLDEPLLFKGEDFHKTDIVPAV